MGNNNGIIQNKTGDQFAYTLHYKELSPNEKITKGTSGGEINANFKDAFVANAKVQDKSLSELKETLQTGESVYALPPYRITSAGLCNVDFNTVRNLTIFNVTKQKYLVQNSKISSAEHIRLVIEKAGNINAINESTVESLQKICDSQALESGQCGDCHQIATLRKVEGKCMSCQKICPILWYCNVTNVHTLCKECEDGYRVQAAIKNLNQ